MNRFSEIINESTDLQDFKDQLISIYDILGEPQTATMRFGEKLGYVFKWNLSFDIDQYNSEKEMMDLVTVFDIVRNQISSIRLKDYDVEFKIDGGFFIRLTPHTQDLGEGYKFVVGQNWRQIIVDHDQVTKFFKDRGYSIRSSKVFDNQLNETSNIVITTDSDLITTKQFEELFNAEIHKLYNEDETINRLIECNVSNQTIYISPDESKTYVVFDRSL
jgi:hypothetical protein